MFQDLSNTDLTKISPERTKASPSVRSENDGSFNSEENLRWISRKITSKPYIVGKDTAEVNNSLKPSVSAFGMYIGKGMFDIDGYLFKVEGGNEQISYDIDSSNAAPFVLDTQYVQRFVGDMIRYGDQNKEIRCEYSDFCFSEYDPGNQNNDASDMKELWETALAEHDVIGFVRIVYNSEYLSQLDNSGHGTIWYRDSSGNIIGSLAVRNSISSTYMTPDEIRTNIFNDGVDQYTSICNELNNELYTYYPVYVETDDNGSAVIVFTDVFGFTWQHAVRKFNTSTYPSTVSNLIDMDASSVGAQNPFNGVSQFQCKLDTYPNKRYMYNMLYDSGSSYTRKTSGISGSIQSSMDTFSYVQKFRISDLHLSVSDQIIPSIENNLSYYCITNIPDNMKLTNGVYTRPVALFTSEGSLCTDGLITGLSTNYAYDGTGSSIESYVHFIKRRYLMAVSEGQWSEDAIKTVTREQVVNWDGFSTFYNTYIAPAMSEYLNLCYYSLMDNVFYGTVLTDSKNIKMHNSGKYIQNITGATANEFSTDYTFNATKHINGSATPQQVQKTLRFESDTTSDKYKTRLFVDRNSGSISLLDGLTYYRQYAFDSENSDMQLMLEDPLLFLRHCVGSAFGVSNMNLLLPDGNTATIGGNVQVDDYFAPKRQTMNDTCFELSTYNSILRSNGTITSSVASSLSYSFYRNTWEMRIPTTISINKESLDYLCGRDYDDPTKYDGFTFGFKMPHDVKDSELYVFDTLISTCRQGESYDVEQSSRLPFYASENIRIKREAFIHTSKIYGDDNKDFNNTVKEIANDLISESLDGYDLSDFPKTEDALIDHIDYGPKNQIQIVGNPNMPCALNTQYKPNANSNVVFRYYRDSSTYPYVDKIQVYLDSGTVATATSEFIFKFYCAGGELRLVGCPSGGSVNTFYAAIMNQPTTANVITDTGSSENVVTRILTPKEMYYGIKIKAGCEIPSDTGLLFVPMLCSDKAYALTNKHVAYTDSVASLKNDIDAIDGYIDSMDKTLISTINRPAKNFLCRYNGTDQGYMIIKTREPLDKNDGYVIHFDNLETDDSQSTIGYVIYNENMEILRYGAFSKSSQNKTIVLNEDTIFNELANPQTISYVRVGNGWSSTYTPISSVTVTSAMMCKLSEWNITNKYVEGIGDITNSLISLCDRCTKNLITSTSFPSFSYPYEPVVNIRTEGTLPIDDYVLSFGYASFSGSICLVDSYGNESAECSHALDQERNTVIYFNKDSLISSNLTGIRYVRFKFTSTPTSSAFSRCMLCKKSDWIISEQFEQSVSGLSLERYLAEMEKLNGTLALIIDSSSKNLYSGTDIDETNVNYVEIDITEVTESVSAISTPFVLSIGNITSSESGNAFNYYIDYTPQVGDSYTDGPFSLIRDDSGHASSIFTLSSSNVQAKIRLYLSENEEAVGNISCTDIMICYDKYYNISSQYVPYSPSNAKLYKMIQELNS